MSRQSEEKLRIKQPKPEEKFGRICNKHLHSSFDGLTGLVKRIDYLDVEVLKNQKKESGDYFQASLNNIHNRIQLHIEDAAKGTLRKKKDSIGEEHGVSKILNEQGRLQKLKSLNNSGKKKKKAQGKTRSKALAVSSSNVRSQSAQGYNNITVNTRITRS